MVNSILDSLRRVARSGKLNTYTEVSKEAADSLDIPSSSVTKGLNDSRDAFRHGYTSAIMTHRYGNRIATIAGDANEMKNHIPSPKDVMVDIGEKYATAVAAVSGRTPIFNNSSPAKRVRPEEEWME